MSAALIAGGLALVALGLGLGLVGVELVRLHRRLVAVERQLAALPCADVSAPASVSSTTEHQLAEPGLIPKGKRPGRPQWDLAVHAFTAARAARESERTNVGREGQPALGRHTAEYQATIEPTVGLFPMGAAGRVTLDEHLADGTDVDRGDRQSWSPPRFTDEETPDAS